MTRKIITGLVAFIIVIVVNAQSSYKDSLLKYQLNYKKDLFEIIKGDTVQVRFYPIDASFKVTADVEKLTGEKFFNLPTSSGMSKQAIRYLKLKFHLHGKEYILYAYRLSMLMSSEKYKDDFFIPFTDATSGIDSYGGGKYIDFVIKDVSEGNKLVIDFNRSYNPYCAFSSGYNCPIPPKENDLPVEIKAGEMNFHH